MRAAVVAVSCCAVRCQCPGPATLPGGAGVQGPASGTGAPMYTANRHGLILTGLAAPGHPDLFSLS